MTILEFLGGLFSGVWQLISSMTFPGLNIPVTAFFWGIILTAVICKVISLISSKKE